MEGLPSPASLPPIATPGGFQQQPQQFQIPRPPGASGGVVGRPSADPEVQQQRVKKSEEMKRIEGVLPKQVDSKLQVFKADRSGKIPYNGRPIATFLLRDLETANANGTATDDVVKTKLQEKHDDGRFICRFVDRAGKPINQSEYPPFEIILGDEDAQLDADVAADADEDEESITPEFAAPPTYPSAPPPTGLDLGTFTRSLDSAREQEARRGNDMAALIASMQTNMTQMMNALAQQQAADRESARREAADREQREAARRSEFRQTLITALPLVLPFVERIFGPKKDTVDPTQMLMLELFRSKMTEKGSDVGMMDQMMKIMGTMTEQQMKLQSAGAATAVQMQSEASTLVFKNMMSTMKELMESKKEVNPKEDSTFQTIIKAAGPLLANLASQQPPNPNAAPGFPPPQAPSPTANAGPVEAEVVAPRKPKVLPPPPPAEPATAEGQPRRKKPAPTDFSDDERISTCLDTIRKLSTGEIPAEQRFNALQWVTKWAPDLMVAAVKTGSREEVMTIGQTAVMSSPVLINWLSTDGMIVFLETALKDLKLILDGTLTRERVVAGSQENKAFVQQRTSQPPVGEVVKKPEAAGPPTAEPVQGQPVSPASAPSSMAVPPLPRRRGRPAKIEPPAPPEVNGSADTSASTPPEPPAPTAGG